MRENYVRNISASRGAGILGLSKWSTPFGTWLRMQEERRPGFAAEKGYVTPEPIEYNAAMRMGHLLEKPMIDVVCDFDYSRVSDIERYYEDACLTCHIDCRIDGIINENKTVYQRAFFAWGKPGTDRVPSQYQIQTQHQMMLTGDDIVHINALVLPFIADDIVDMYGVDDDGNLNAAIDFSGWSFALSEMGYLKKYYIERHDDLIKMMREMYYEFWYKNILEEIPPEPETFDDIKSMIVDPCGVVVLDDDQESLVREYTDIKKELGKTGSLSKRAEDLKVGIMKIALDEFPNMNEELKNESRDKIVFMNRQGKKLKSYTAKGGLR